MKRGLIYSILLHASPVIVALFLSLLPMGGNSSQETQGKRKPVPIVVPIQESKVLEVTITHTPKKNSLIKDSDAIGKGLSLRKRAPNYDRPCPDRYAGVGFSNWGGLVDVIATNSPAERLGLRKGDLVITHVPFTDKKGMGEPVSFKIMRDNKVLEFKTYRDKICRY